MFCLQNRFAGRTRHCDTPGCNLNITVTVFKSRKVDKPFSEKRCSVNKVFGYCDSVPSARVPYFQQTSIELLYRSNCKCEAVENLLFSHTFVERADYDSDFSFFDRRKKRFSSL